MENGKVQFHPGKYRREAVGGQVTADGACHVAVTAEELLVQPESGAEFALYHSDIEQVEEKDWQIRLSLADQTAVVLYFLGGWHGQCLRELKDARGAQLVRNLLMLDAGFVKEFRGAYVLTGEAQRQQHADSGCTIQLYRSSLVVQPDHGDFFNVAYADIERMRFDSADYALKLSLEGGGQLAFRMLGTRFGELEREIRLLTEAMLQRTAAALEGELKDLLPAGSLGQAVRLLQGQKAISQAGLEQAAPGFWAAFESRLIGGGEGSDEGEVEGEVEAESAPDGGTAGGAALRQACIRHLTALAGGDRTYLGFRETFYSSETRLQPVYWFVALFPEQGRAAVEVIGENAHATYVYRMEGEPEAYVRLLSRALVAINFRRDVIQMPDSALGGDRLARYRVALRKLAYVRRLRELFVGRVAHTNEAAWQRGLEALLRP